MDPKTVSRTKIWLSPPHMGGSELAYVNGAFDTNWIAPLGPNVDHFENDLTDYLGNGSHVAALSSGTAALHLGLKLLDVGPGDKVLCQSFTFSASANPIKYLGGTPIFVDSEKKTWNISPELLEKAIQDSLRKGDKPKCIIAVHLYGMPYLVDDIHYISEKYDIPVLEDSAEALGSMFKGSRCGTLGKFAVLSFNGNKIITTSGGGALVSKNEDYREKTIFLATQARDNAPHYQHSVIGYNYRMSNVLAGIGRGQMEVLDDRVSSRRFNYNFYENNLKDIGVIKFLDEPDGCFSNRWLTCILAPSFEIRERIRCSLLEDDIDCRPLWKPMHLQPVFRKSDCYVNGVSKELFERGLCLPSGSNLTEEDLNRICISIKKAI